MFWKREERINHYTNGLGPLLEIPVPPQKEYKAILELLRDAEKYDNQGEKEIAKDTLKVLSKHILEYCNPPKETGT